MATNRIKIEVDFDNAVAKINDLKIKFDEIGNKAVATRARIEQMVKSTKDATDGSIKALQRERTAWQQIQASLSSTNEQYRKYQVQIDALDKQIAKITDTRKREEIALKNSSNGLKQQIDLIRQEMENRKLSNTQYRIMNDEVAKLEARLQALTDTRQRHEVVQKNSIADFDQQIAALREEQRNTALSADAVGEYEQRIESLRLKKRALTSETRSLDKASQSFSSSAGVSGAAVTEFGRVIGDAPFGLIGVSNNIQQLSQQLVDLRNKSGGVKEAFNAFKATLLGPAGLVVLVNIVTSGLLALQMRKRKLNKETEKFTDSMLLEASVLKQLTNMYEMSNDQLGKRNSIIASLAAADSDYSKALAKLGNNEEARNKLTDNYLDIRNRINESEENRNNLAEENKKLLSEELLSKKERNDLEGQYERLLSGPLDESVGRAIGQIKGMLNLDNQRREVNGEIIKSTNEIAKAQEELNRLLNASEYDKAIDDLKDYREELRLLRNFTEGPERIAEEIRVLRERLSEEAVKAGTTETATYQQILLELLQKEEEFYQESIEKRKEADEKEKERLESLAEINKQYLDDLEAQLDESGIIRLNQQERDAIAEAKALGASRANLLRIEQFYINERQRVFDEAEEKASEKRAKEDEKKAKEDEKNQKKALEKNKKRLEEFFDQEMDAMKKSVDTMSDIFSNFGTLLDELGDISQSRFERQIGMLREERDIVRSNDATTKEEKEQQLTDIRRRENVMQRERIKAERDMFTLKQTIVIAEMVLKQRAFVQEQIMMAQLISAQAKLSMTAIGLTAAEETAEASMSIGTFMKQLGPFGIAAFALSIGGVIASIVSARRKATAEIAGLSDAPVSLGIGGGGAAPAAPSAPSFNVVGASAQNQLAAAIAGQQSEPVRAYVVSSDVSTAQELDRKIVEGASI